MLIKLSNRLYFLTRGWLIIVLFIALMIFNMVILPAAMNPVQTASGSTASVEGLDLKYFYTPNKAYSVIAAYNDKVRSLYRAYELTGDIVMPVLYSSVLGLVISWLFQRSFNSGNRWLLLNVLPVGAGFCDVMENICIVTMITIFPSRSDFIAWVSTIFTMLKWSLLVASVLLLLLGLVMAIKNRFKKQSVRFEHSGI